LFWCKSKGICVLLKCILIGCFKTNLILKGGFLDDVNWIFNSALIKKDGYFYATGNTTALPEVLSCHPISHSYHLPIFKINGTNKTV